MCSTAANSDRAVLLDGKSIDEYLRKIKGYVDELAGVGVPDRHEEYVDVLLEGLPSDYALIISVIESNKRTPSIAEIEALLYGHKTRLARYSKEARVLSSPSLNYTQGYSHKNSYKSGHPGGSRGLYGRGNGRGGFPDRSAGRSGGGFGRGGGGHFANFHCQICLKYGSKCIDWGPKPFKVYDGWLMNKQFQKVVRDCWLDYQPMGWGGYALKCKLQHLK